MKKSIVIILAAFTTILIACNMGLPENIYLRLKSQYAFSMGNYEKFLSEYISVDTLSNSFNSESSEVKFKIYDYNPEDKSSLQQYLIDFSFGEIPVNLGQYLSDMDFAEDISAISFDETIDIPTLGTGTTPATSISLPDINRKICSSVSFPSMPVTILTTGSVGPQTISVPVSGVTYTSLTFSSGYLNAKITPPSGVSGSVSLTLKIGSAQGSVKVSGTTPGTAKIPLSGISVGQTIGITVSGNAASGAAGAYSISFSLSDDTKVQKITGLTMDLGSDGTINVNQTITMSVNSTFKSCKISQGTIKAYSNLPTGWQNIGLTSDLALSGGLTASNSDLTDKGGSGYLLNREMDLAGTTYTAGNINLTGTLSISLSNSTIVFNDTNKVDVNIECNVVKVDHVNLDLNSIADKLSIDDTESLPVGMQKYIKFAKITNSGIKAKYTNTLPAGNDVTIETVSNFFGLGSTGNPKKEILYANTTDGNLELLSTSPKTISPATDSSIDFKVDIKLPGAASENPTLAKLTNIELGKSYKFKVELTPVFDWDSVGLDASAVDSISETLDTDFDLGTIFNELTDVLQDPTVVNKLEFTDLPVYLYAMAPECDSLPLGINFEGSLTGSVGTDSVKILPTKTEIEAGETKGVIPICFGKHELTKNSKGVVITDLDSDTECAKADLADLINKHGSGKLKIDYTLKLCGMDSNVIEIKKSDLKDLSISSICIVARMLVKLKLKITDALELDLLKLADIESDKDLFERDSATDYSDYEKYIDTIKSISIVYTVKNTVMNYSDPAKNVKITLESKNPEITKTLSLNGGSLGLTVDEMKKVLNCAKFTPTIKMEAPTGVISISRDASIAMNAAIIMYADGEVLIK